MAVVPQLINIGSVANDGTGDRPRPMAIKYNNTVLALAAAINAGITGAAITSGRLVITKADGSSIDVGLVGGSGGTATVAGNTLVQLPALTAAASTLLAGSDTVGNLGGLTLSSLLAWVVSQAPDIAASPQVSAVLTGDLLPLIRNGSIVLVPATATMATAPSNGGSTTTPTVATTFGVTASPASVVVGSAVMFYITPGSGGWPNGEVVTPSVNGVSGTFDQATKTGVGTNTVTFVFTPSTAGTATLSASANGMNLSGSPAQVTVTAAATSQYAVLASAGGTQQYETANPIQGSASLKATSGVTASSTIVVAASPDAGSNGDASQGYANVGFYFRSADTNAFGGSGEFLTFGPSGRNFGMALTGKSIQGRYSSSVPASVNIRDGLKHWISVYLYANGNKMSWGMFVDGTLVAREDSVSAFNYWQNGNQPFTLIEGNLTPGDVIDSVTITNSGDASVVPSGEPTRGSATNVIWLFNLQSGIGS